MIHKGDRVITKPGGTRVYLAASFAGTYAQLPAGIKGFVILGPTVAEGFTWWKVSYSNGKVGWSTEPNIALDTTAPAIGVVVKAVITSVDVTPQAIVVDGVQIRTVQTTTWFKA